MLIKFAKHLRALSAFLSAIIKSHFFLYRLSYGKVFSPTDESIMIPSSGYKSINDRQFVLIVNIQFMHMSRNFLQVNDSLEDIIGDLIYVIEGEIEPGNVLRYLHQVQSQLVKALGIHKVVVGQTDHVAIVPKVYNVTFDSKYISIVL